VPSETIRLMEARRPAHWLGWPSATLVLVLLFAGTGCQVTAPSQQMEGKIHSRDDIAVNAQQLRLRTRALVEPFCGLIVDSADRIMAGTTNRVIQREALRWKIEAVPAMREALFLQNPFAAITDAWVLTWQMTDHFESGEGEEALGDAAAVARTTCSYLESEITSIVASVTYSGDVSKSRSHARNWAAEHPIRHSIAGRESVMNSATEREIEDSFTTTEIVGDLSVTLDDLSRRLDIYGAQLFEQSRWQAELFAMDMAEDYQVEKAIPLAESAVQSATDAVDAMNRIVPLLESALSAAEAAPEVVAKERAAAIEAVHGELARTLQFLQEELIAALQHITKEREVALVTLNQYIVAERQALTQEAEVLSLEVVDYAFWRLAQLAIVLWVVSAIALFCASLFLRACLRIGKGAAARSAHPHNGL